MSLCSFVLTFILTFFVILVLWCSSPLLFLPPYSLSSVFWTLGSWKSFQVLLLEAAGIASSMLLGDSFGDETSTNALFLWTNSRFSLLKCVLWEASLTKLMVYRSSSKTPPSQPSHFRLENVCSTTLGGSCTIAVLHNTHLTKKTGV